MTFLICLFMATMAAICCMFFQNIRLRLEHIERMIEELNCDLAVLHINERNELLIAELKAITDKQLSECDELKKRMKEK